MNATLSGWVVTGDFNLDGKLDVAVGGYGADAYLLFGNGNGTLKFPHCGNNREGEGCAQKRQPRYGDPA